MSAAALIGIVMLVAIFAQGSQEGAAAKIHDNAVDFTESDKARLAENIGVVSSAHGPEPVGTALQTRKLLSAKSLAIESGGEFLTLAKKGGSLYSVCCKYVDANGRGPELGRQPPSFRGEGSWDIQASYDNFVSRGLAQIADRYMSLKLLAGLDDVSHNGRYVCPQLTFSTNGRDIHRRLGGVGRFPGDADGLDCSVGRFPSLDQRVVKGEVGLVQDHRVDDGGGEQQRGPGNEPPSKPINWYWLFEPPQPFLYRLLLFAAPGFLCSLTGFVFLFGPHLRPNLGAMLYFGGMVATAFGLFLAV